MKSSVRYPNGRYAGESRKEFDERKIAENGTRVYMECPIGWKPVIDATTQPKGYVWIFNGKSRFGGEYDHALLKLNDTLF